MEIFVTKARTGEQAVRMDHPEVADRKYSAAAMRLLTRARRIN
jgi:hypothetical protein